jgi:hypothetical protein
MNTVLSFFVPIPLFGRPFPFNLKLIVTWFFWGSLIVASLYLFTIFQNDVKDDITLSEAIELIIAGGGASCFYGLVGLIPKNIWLKSDGHPGIFWLFFPVIGAFLVAILIIMLVPLLFGHNQFSRPSGPDRTEQLKQMTGKELLSEFGEQIQEMEQQGALAKDEKEVWQKMQNLDKNELRLQLQEALKEDEMKILLKLVLQRILGIIVKF